jgi:glycosyltransferase involved in cell wall biosynthesis
MRKSNIIRGNLMERKPLIIACIPAYNEEKTIAKIVLLTQKFTDKVVVCDDGSKDLTGEIARRLGADVLKHERNMGYGAAVASLFRRARELNADMVITLDADGQHDPEEIPNLIRPLLNGDADIVIGSRFMGKGETPKYRLKGVRMITDLTDKITDLGLTDSQCGFRAYSRKALEIIFPSEMGMGVSTEILVKAAEANLRVKEVPISIRYKGLKTSTHNTVYHAIDVVASTIKHFSIRHPLLFYGIPALVFFIVGVCFGAWALHIYATEARLVTNITLIAIASILIAVIFITTAIILYTLVSIVKEQR